MSKFKFKFDNIARIKATIKKKILRDISQMDNKIAKFQDDIQKLKASLQEEKEYYFQKHSRVEEMQTLERHEIFIKKKINSFENEIRKLKKLKTEKVNELTKLAKEEKILELLKEKHLEKYLYEEKKIEEKFFDEIALRLSSRGEK